MYNNNNSHYNIITHDDKIGKIISIFNTVFDPLSNGFDRRDKPLLTLRSVLIISILGVWVSTTSCCDTVFEEQHET